MFVFDTCVKKYVRICEKTMKKKFKEKSFKLKAI